MFENFTRFFKKIGKAEPKELDSGNRESKETAKERLHMVLMQDRANVSADFLELMKQEIIDVIKKYIEVNEDAIDVRLTTKTNEDGSNGTPSLYANIPILNIRNDMKVENYKFALQSDGSIIAEKIEDPKDEINEDVVNLDNTDIDSEKENIEILNEENEKKNIENEKIEEPHENEEIEKNQEEIEKENELKIEQRQNDIIKEIIPAMENLEKYDTVNPFTTENNTETIEENLPKVEDIQEEKVQEEVAKVEEKKDEVVEPVVPLKKSARRGRPKKKDKKEKSNDKKTKNEEKISESSEDDDDDDVTFDDLLKAAEEEDRKKAEQEKKRG